MYNNFYIIINALQIQNILIQFFEQMCKNFVSRNEKNERTVNLFLYLKNVLSFRIFLYSDGGVRLEGGGGGA